MDSLKLLALSTALFIVVGYFFSRLTKRNDIADTLWGMGFLWLSLVTLNFSPDAIFHFKSKIVLVMVSLWALRLSLHIGLRTMKKSEDIRYLNWRKGWGKREPFFSFFKVFALQGVILLLISWPLHVVFLSPVSEVCWTDFLGASLFIFGFLFETVADAQLTAFKAQKEKKSLILQEGLWSLCRHPNYFGETLIWWGFFFLAVGSAEGNLFFILSPLLITFLLIKVSGIAMLEPLLAKKGEEFARYVKRTPAFLPFKKEDFFIFVKTVIVLVALDYLWLGLFMKDFYVEQTHQVARINGGEFDVVLWGAVMVYFFIPLSIILYGTRKASSRWDALFRGGVLGLTMYAIYEFTNIALVKNWPLSMALVDLCWGSILCGLTSFLTFTEKKQ